MPTDRPRHLITESDEVARALDDAAERWPEDRGRRARLLVRLLMEGHQSLRARLDHEHEARRDAVRRTSGALSGVYGPDHLTELRKEWPA